MPPYLLDANFFIEAHRKSYPLDVFPSFWEKIKTMADAGLICSIDKVKNELFKNEDALKTWCEQNLPDDFFKESATSLSEYAQVVNWAYAKLDHPYSQSALDIFMNADEADAFLVAFAKKHALVVVTNEVSAPDSKRNVKLPDACLPFGVRSLTPVQLFRELRTTI
ncbi:MAG: DUF4411 family protein [Saprospiraceae bacterium]|nr:DUF4411 family protein [Saprospiraceae bacterium]MCF8252749.1 DUF4411 family protein [Saprospiraceae bacterium]MCF8283121.1 DUF4411 family protein [Bacteroidales bacterium]MCF8314315.1 DUF4411 family protein [Saprospiraceae bacterium]MCF8443176.1 DUF4411 family protein [Saprospiraceae bacterium]